jgi:hypothetical protein
MLALKRLLLNRELILLNVLKVLASIISLCSLHVILLLKIAYIYIFYTIDKRDIPAIQCKMSLRRA